MNMNYLVYLSVTEFLGDISKGNYNDTNDSITTETIAKQNCPSSGIYPNLIFIVNIQSVPCQLKLRTVKLSDEDYIINGVLSGIKRIGKSEVRVMQLNTNKIINQQGRKNHSQAIIINHQQSQESKQKSIIQRIKHGLILPLLNMQSLTLTAMPGQILMHILSYCQATGLCRLSSVCKQFHQFSSENILWSHLLQKSFGHHSLPTPDETTDDMGKGFKSFKDAFKKNYLKKKTSISTSSSSSSYHYRQQQQQAVGFHLMDPFYPHNTNNNNNNNDLDPDFNLNFHFPYDTNPLEIERLRHHQRNLLYHHLPTLAGNGINIRNGDNSNSNGWRPPILNDGTISTGFPHVFQS